jgi:hypothetical protein
MQVEHSPEFLPRVRRRVELEQATASDEAWWRFAAAGTALSAAALIIAAVVWPARDIVTSPMPPAPASPVAKVAPPIAPAIATERPAARRAVNVTPREAGRRPFPDVLISADDRRGLELAVRAARDGRLPAALIAQSRNGDPVRMVAPIEIAPLNIQPLPEIAPFQGERP